MALISSIALISELTLIKFAVPDKRVGLDKLDSPDNLVGSDDSDCFIVIFILAVMNRHLVVKLTLVVPQTTISPAHVFILSHSPCLL